MKVCFETFGCRLNRAEALDEEAKYLARGWELTESHADAQLIVIRGCSVTARAQRDCERLIDHIRRKYPFKRVIVTGCLPSAQKDYHVRTAADPSDADRTAVPTRTARAYLKVQDGCSGACTFCIVPKFRGKSVSVPFDECLARARRFIDAGYHEIVVTGCNLALYASEGKRLADLVAALADLAPVMPTDASTPGASHALAGCRIRLGSVEPGPAATELLRVMAEKPNVCRFLHIPVQSGSPRLLTAMRRPYTVHDVDALVRQAMALTPHLGLGCDLMAGFPDERDNDQIATISLLKRLPFSRAHVFPYSERPGTVAASLPHAVPREIRAFRARELAARADEARTNFARRFKGHIVEIVVEDEKTVSGWTSEYLWCRIGEPRRGVKRKDLVRLRVREVAGHQLIGELA